MGSGVFIAKLIRSSSDVTVPPEDTISLSKTLISFSSCLMRPSLIPSSGNRRGCSYMSGLSKTILARSISSSRFLFSSSFCKFKIVSGLRIDDAGLVIDDASIFPIVPSEVVKIVDNLSGAASNGLVDNKDECMGSRITTLSAAPRRGPPA